MSSDYSWMTRSFLDLQGRVVVITGGAGGLGAALAQAALQRGARVALVDISGERLATTVSQLVGGQDQVSTHVADLTNEAAVQQVVEEILLRHLHVDVLINNAGVSLAGRFADCTLDEFFWVQNINLQATVMLTHYLLPHLRPGAHIVNVSSMAGLVGLPASTAYSASKFAVRGFSESLRIDLYAEGIGVTVASAFGKCGGNHDENYHSPASS